MKIEEYKALYEELKALSEQLRNEAIMISRGGSLDDRLESVNKQGQAMGVLMAAEVVIQSEIEP